MVHRVCKETNQTPDQIFSDKFLTLLDWMAYLKDLDKYERDLRDEQNGTLR